MAPRKSSAAPRGSSKTPAKKSVAAPRASSSSSAAASPKQQQQPTAGTTTSRAAETAKILVKNLSLGRDEPFSSLNPVSNEIVAPSALKNLRNYTYKTIDNSIMQKYCGINKYWDFVVSFVPYWVAPNMLTMLALLCSMSYPLLIFYFESKQTQQPAPEDSSFIPAWVWLFSAVALFAYQTLDSIDGKHARRTGAKGPLGEMFDHGCDALFTPFMLYASSRCLNLTSYQTYVFCLISTFTLYATILEQFLCGIFNLPAINGPTEGVIIGVILYLFTFIMGGSKFWATKLASSFSVSMPKSLVAAFNSAPGSFFTIRDKFVIAENYTDVAFFIFMVLGLITCIGACRSAYMQLGRKNDAIINFAANTFALAMWSLFPVIYPDMAYTNVRGFCITFGIYFAFAASDLTVFRLVELPARVSPKMFLLGVGFPIAKLLIFRSRSACFNLDQNSICKCFATDLAVAMTGCYIFYLLSVFNQFARGLGVNVVTLTDDQVKVSEAEHFKRSRK